MSQQELDERRSGVAQARANLAAADANVERLRQLEGFKRVVAPFSGVITRRNVDVGDLIDAGAAAARALFVLAQTDPLRVYVNVPQAYAQLVRPGQKVSVTQAELRGQTFAGEVARTAASIDSGDAHDAGRDRAAEPRRHAAARRLRPGGAAAASERDAASCRPTRCCSAARARASRSSTRSGRVHLRADHASAATRRERSRCWTASPPRDRLVLNPVRFAGRRRHGRHRRDAAASAGAGRNDRAGKGRLERRGRCASPAALLLARPAPPAPNYGGRRSTCRRPGSSRRRGAKARPTTRRQGPVVAALRRRAARRARSSRRWPRSPTLAVASARLTQARAALAATSSSLLPQVGLGDARGAPDDLRQPAAHQLRLAQFLDGAERLHRWRCTVNYEVDLAGRVQRTIEGARAQREQSAADLENTRLLLDHRSRDGLLQPARDRHRARRAGALDRAAAALARARQRAPRPRRRLGLDVAQQQALLDSTLTQVDVLRRQRGQFEHAIATLTGTPAPLVLARARHARRSRRRRCRSACRPTSSSAGPTSPRPSARWRPPTRRSASPRAAFYPSITIGADRAASRAASLASCSTRRA